MARVSPWTVTVAQRPLLAFFALKRQKWVKKTKMGVKFFNKNGSKIGKHMVRFDPRPKHRRLAKPHEPSTVCVACGIIYSLYYIFVLT